MSYISRRTVLCATALAAISGVARVAPTLGQTAELGHTSRFSPDRRGSALTRQTASIGDPLRALDELLERESGVYGLMVIDQNGNLRYRRNAGLPFVSASLYKLVLAADILRRIERRFVSFDQVVRLEAWYFPATDNFDGAYGFDAIGTEITIEEALWSSICVSSNVASMALLQLTSTETMNALSLEQGLMSTNFSSVLENLDFWPPDQSTAESAIELQSTVQVIERNSWEWNVNLTTPADMTRFTHAVLRGTLVSEFVSGELLRLLLAQEVNDRMPALLPAGTAVAHKTGNLTSIVHDAGAIISDNGPILLTMLTQAVPDESHTTRLLQTIAAMVYAELQPS